MTDFDLAKFNNCAINELDDVIEMSREWTEYHFNVTKFYHEIMFAMYLVFYVTPFLLTLIY